jgi:hypothetical protein
MRKQVLFKTPSLKCNHVVSSSLKQLYPQETDWTCSIACIRTILSANDVKISENEYIQTYRMSPQPYYSKDIKNLHILDEYKTVYGCDNPCIPFDDILNYMQNGYCVMVECLYNYAHWLVLLGYYPCSNGNIEQGRLLAYDPYYNEVRLLNVDEFLAMWIDGDYEHTRVKQDFIAILPKILF